MQVQQLWKKLEEVQQEAQRKIELVEHEAAALRQDNQRLQRRLEELEQARHQAPDEVLNDGEHTGIEQALRQGQSVPGVAPNAPGHVASIATPYSSSVGPASSCDSGVREGAQAQRSSTFGVPAQPPARAPRSRRTSSSEPEHDGES